LEPIIQAVDAFRSVYEFLKDIKEIINKSKKGGCKLFISKKTETIERKFKEALIGTKNAIESSIWYGKGFAIQAECGSKVDKSFHTLMGLFIMRFNDIQMRIDPEKLDEKLIEHLVGQLKILEEHAQRFWNIQGSSGYQDKEERVLKMIEDFESRLLDFSKSMETYLKVELRKTSE
jgi:hypothetical protein